MESGAAIVEISGHEARSAKTRMRLIEAAIEVISTVGYEATTTRTLAHAAKTALSAIPYHFGGKKELYLAAAEEIADYAHARFKEVTDILDASQAGDETSRFEEALIRFLHILLEDVKPRAWTSFVARCAYENDEAYALIHDRAIGPLLQCLVRYADGRREGAPESEVIRLRINAIVTSIISFRFLRGVVVRGMDWDAIQGESTRQIEEMIRDICRSDFLRSCFGT